MCQLSTLVFCFVDNIYHKTTAATGADSASMRHDGCHCEVCHTIVQLPHGRKSWLNIASAYHSKVSAESYVIVNSSWTSHLGDT